MRPHFLFYQSDWYKNIFYPCPYREDNIQQQEYLQIKADILEHLLIEKMQREAQFLLQSPEEIYRTLLEKDPKLIQNIPLKYIASYIGITPQALSRIRKRIF